jgi:transcriptional regulator with GAF, ATPase, and Fis domain
MAPGRIVEGQRKDGTVFPVEVGLSPATFDGQHVVLASVIDTTIRSRLEQELADRNDFEQAIAEIAAGFVSASDDEVDERIVGSLGRLCALLAAERGTLWREQDGDLTYTHAWTAPGIAASAPPAPARLAAQTNFPWVTARLRQGMTTCFTQRSELPSPVDRDSYQRIGTQSGVAVPLMGDGQVIGALSFAVLSAERPWSAYSLRRLPLVASVFASALARRRARAALEAAHAEVQRLRDQLATENVQLRREVRALKGPRVLATESAAAQQVLAQIEQVAPTTATVLVLGETGSGKEAFAEVVHELSPRRGKPMVRVNCSAIPATLIESELFGRERGAYTGALSRQLGRFEIADGSTIFLDEVGELPAEVQVKLLRVLQDRVIERLGSSQPIKVDVRIIAATNRDLEQAIADRTFREDLYYRLNVFPIRVPPLRERVEDIPSLVWSFINEFATAFGKNVESLSKASLQALQAYSWPGNIRELRNVVERAVIVASGPHLVITPPRPGMGMMARQKSLKFTDVEKEHIRSVLESTAWRIRGTGGAADLLGIKPTTLESRMARLGIVRGERQGGSPDRPVASRSARGRIREP